MSFSIDDLKHFLDHSPTPFHVVETVTQRLQDQGFVALDEGTSWSLSPGKYFVSRKDTSVIAFKIAANDLNGGFRMVGAHTDSPCLKLKPNAASMRNGYLMLGLEVYGGVLLNPWFDRDLGIAGRITVRDQHNNLQHRNIKSTGPIGVIPSLAIHLDPKVNQGREINAQQHLPILIGTADETFNFAKFLLQLANLSDQQYTLVSHELSLFDMQPAQTLGINNEFLVSARLDNLLSCYAATEALCAADDKSNQLMILSDHEEVGSRSYAGADGTFLTSVCERLCQSREQYLRVLSQSVFFSVDNAHAIHPNYADKHEPDHAPVINSGVTLKTNNNQRYATNSQTEAQLKQVAHQLGLSLQHMVVRSDMGCGSTIGPITASRLGIDVVDLGVPQLAMHSIREMAGVRDQSDLLHLLTGFYQH